METRHYWEENGHATVKYDNYNTEDGYGRAQEQVNFAPPSEDEAEYPAGGYLKKGKQQDPMSHRIIEKRRRDRMNNCLADLSRLIPPEYLKKGRGRVEKTEIIEMAIRHLKYLQERAIVAERQVPAEHFRAGFQEAAAEMMRYLADQGYNPADGLCVQLAAHLQRHCDHVIKGDILRITKPPKNGLNSPSIPVHPKENMRKEMRSHAGSSSETTSSSGSSHGYAVKQGVIAQVPTAVYPEETYERPPEPYPMDCDRVPQANQVAPMTESDAMIDSEPLPLDGRRKREPTLRTIRKPDHEDFIHSYKFKNSIERRFSRSQDSEAADMLARTAHAHGKVYTHKRRRAAKLTPSTSTSASGSTEDARDTSPQDTSSDSPHHHHHYDKPQPPAQYVPVFALNALGKYYVPLSVDNACLARHLGAYDVLDARAAHLAAPLHPVTIHVNFQPCLNYHVKPEPNEREWRAV